MTSYASGLPRMSNVSESRVPTRAGRNEITSPHVAVREPIDANTTRVGKFDYTFAIYRKKLFEDESNYLDVCKADAARVRLCSNARHRDLAGTSTDGNLVTETALECKKVSGRGGGEEGGGGRGEKVPNGIGVQQ